MTNINIGNKIRELRKKKGITQEMLASVLLVSPQAISKWESGISYPDIGIIPTIASYFEVSLDILFDYDIREMKKKIKNIITDAQEYFFDNTEKYIETIKQAILEYPDNEALLYALLDAYEYKLRTFNDISRLEEMITLAEKIIAETNDFIKICKTKDILAAALLKKGDYTKARSTLESLPCEFNIRHAAFAFRLSGDDKKIGAIASKNHHIQGLYIACLEEGDSRFSQEDIDEAMLCYEKGLLVLTSFLIKNYKTPADQYLWDGMQTFHWIFHQRIAACYKKLGKKSECDQQIKAAKEIVRSAWKDFDENKEQIMLPFNQYLCDFDLSEYTI